MSDYFDAEKFLKHEHGDVDFACEMINAFLELADSYLDNIRSARDAGDMEALGKAAHKIKGAIATFQSEEVRALALDVEKAGKAGDVDAARTGLAKLESAVATMQEEMQHFLKEQGKG